MSYATEMAKKAQGARDLAESLVAASHDVGWASARTDALTEAQVWATLAVSYEMAAGLTVTRNEP